MNSIVLVGCGGAGIKFLSYVRRFTTGTSISINDSRADIVVNRNRIGLGDSLPISMIYEIYPWLEKISGANVIVLAGLGGNTGTQLAETIGVALHSKSRLIGIFSEPFSSESPERLDRTEKAMSNILKNYATVILLSNEALAKYYPHLPINKMFNLHPIIMRYLIQDIERLIIKNMVNFEFTGRLGVGIGFGAGKDRIRLAINDAMDSPWHAGRKRYAFITGDAEREDVKITIGQYDFEFWDFYPTEEYGEKIRATVFSK